VREFADELRHARLAAGLTQAQVAVAAGTSAPTVSRIERGKPPYPGFVAAARLARVVGLDLSVRCYPAGTRLRDAGHLALLRRFLATVPPDVGRMLEAPIRLPGDQRAWDVVLSAGGLRVGVAAETRLRDVQALLRREQAKARDDGVDRLILVVAATKANRRVVHEAWPVLSQELPLASRHVMSALRAGNAPDASGIVLC
jgi:transcriptional regulator with XRE-family HTH domain